MTTQREVVDGAQATPFNEVAISKLVGLKHRPDHAIRVAVVPNNRQATLQGFVRGHLEPGARLYTPTRLQHAGTIQEMAQASH